ncbi:DUF1854 domain-containing protein [Schlegelella sp. S2-27]|uniref:DUF1854 domain-containing protein n=1 Tax=Caldimonas mangrovi TaxID=2944811 RepID=A0ABT0YH53_9BURK|nr:DUF1854 domain-containing protein [Caldimonas mangrovi]MCM5678069.1 DUF1854 domain-containing protein [Caldimonas mangrovi]
MSLPTLPFIVERNAYGKLVLVTGDGERHNGVTPVRAFPIAAPDEGVALVGTDGHELAWIDRLEDLPAQQQALLREALQTREFVPQIVRLRSVSSFSTPSTWDVDTDRGPTQLVLKGEEDIRRLPHGKLLIADAQGVHFLVPDLHALDRTSRRLLDRFLA